MSTHWSLQWSHQDQVSPVSVHSLVTTVVSSRPGESSQCPLTGHCSGLIKTRWVQSVSTHWSLQWSQDQVSPVSVHWSLQWSHQDQVSPVSVHSLVTTVVSSRPGESSQCPLTGHCSGLIKTRWVQSVSTHWSLQWSQDQVSPVSVHWSLQWSHQDQVSPVSVHSLVTTVVSSRPGESSQCPLTGHYSGLIKTR